MGGILETVKSPSFFEKILLLLLTALLSGLLVPVMMQDIAHKKFKEQKVFEADLLRQTKILESQIEFFNIISELLARFQLSALEVSYYKHHKNKDKYEVAVKKYDDNIWDLYIKIHYEIDRAKRLISPVMHQRFIEFYQHVLIPQDSALTNLIERGTETTDDEWNRFHQLVGVNATKARDIVYDLAQELRLAVESSK